MALQGTKSENLHKSEAEPGDAEPKEPSSLAHGRSASRLIDIFCNPFFSVAIIVLICALTFGRTLGSYFLADDIGEVRYVHQIFAGHWDMFWSNFCGNYMQVPNMSVYRPMLLLTLVFDYLCWKGNPLGYYLSNLIYFTGSAALLSVFVRQLCASWGKVRATLTGLAAACLFATNPLHCESISWVVGRVDSACCMFYLAALCVFLTKKPLENKLWNAFAIFLFVLAICTKEMAVGLAPTLAAYAFFFPNSSSAAPNLPERLASSWRFSKSTWIATTVYFACRFLFLKTLLGGYNGSVGASQSASAVSRWFDADNWHRLFFPFPLDLYAQGNSQEQALLGLYAGLAFLVLLRLLANAMPWRGLAFVFVWGLTLIAPIYRLFGLGANLEGARFCFFLSMALSTLLPLLILAPENKLPRALSFKLSALGLLLIACICVITDKCAYATNLLWLHAGKEVKAVCDDAIRISQHCAGDDRAILLGVPKQHSGAHMILNGPTLQMLLAPPFTKQEYWSPLLTFDPILFGDENLINGTRLRALVNRPHFQGPFLWNNLTKHFENISLSSTPGAEPIKFPLTSESPNLVSPCVFGHGAYTMKNGTIRVIFPHNDDGVKLTAAVNPLDYSFLKVSFCSSNNKIKLPFLLRWQAAAGSKQIAELSEANFVEAKLPPDPATGDKTVRSLYIPLGRNWHWYSQSQIAEMSLYLPAVKELTLTNIELLPATAVCPTIDGADQSNNYGVMAYTPGTPLLIHGKLGANMSVQLSKKEFFFDNLDEASANEGILKSFELKGTAATLNIPPEDLQHGGLYQLRAHALDEQKQPVGDYSDTLTISVN